MKKNISKFVALMLGVMMLVGVMSLSAGAESTAPSYDPSPAIYVAEKTASSVVGIVTSQQEWNQSNRTVEDTPIASGSGVVFAEGGYIVTNNHVVEDGDSWQVVMPNGDYEDAELVGTDSSTDVAVLKVSDEAAASLIPVEIGSSSELVVGSTVIAIGTPGSLELSNTVTSGIVSALERSSVQGANASRSIDYIQHDAAINSGNSGGGLFNYKGELVGINTLKYFGSSSSRTYEGLGFAIPVETVAKNAGDIIQYGKVLRPQMGVTVYNYEYGPDEPMTKAAPAGMYVISVGEGTPAEDAGLQEYDYIYSVNGQRVTSMIELTTELDKYQDGDTVTLEIVRYANIELNSYTSNGNSYYSYFFGGSATTYNQFDVSGGYQMVDVDITLKILDD